MISELKIDFRWEIFLNLTNRISILIAYFTDVLDANSVSKCMNVLTSALYPPIALIRDGFRVKTINPLTVVFNIPYSGCNSHCSDPLELGTVKSSKEPASKK